MTELEKISNYVPVQYIVWVIIVLIALLLIGVRIYPTLVKWFNAMKAKTDRYEKLYELTKKNSDDIELINQKIGRDYARLNQLQQYVTRQQEYTKDSLEERELILKSLLGIIRGLQEVGANGPTKAAEKEIQEYLLKKSHELEEENSL